MHRAIQIVLWLATGLVLATIAWWWLIFDPDRFRQPLQEKVLELTGYSLEVSEPLSVTLIPRPRLVMKGLSFGDPMDTQALITLDRMEATFKWFPDVGFLEQLVLIKPGLNLKIDPEGASNWSRLIDRLIQVNPKYQRPGDIQALVLSTLALLLQDSRVEQATIRWHDNYRGQQFEVEDLNITTGRLLPHGNASLTLAGQLKPWPDRQPVPVSLVAHAGLNADDLEVDALYINVDEGSIRGNLKILDISTRQVTGLNIALADLSLDPWQHPELVPHRLLGEINGAIEIETYGLTPTDRIANLSGTLDLKLDNARLTGVDLNQLFLTVPVDLHTRELKTDLSEVCSAIILDQGIASSNTLIARSQGFSLTGSGRADISKQTLQYRGSVALQPDSRSDLTEEALSFPISVRGYWQSPRIDIDYRKFLAARGRAAQLVD